MGAETNNGYFCGRFIDFLNWRKGEGGEPIASGLELSVSQFDDHSDFDDITRRALAYGLEQGLLVAHSYVKKTDSTYPDPLDIIYTLPSKK
jgi:hypothetical protein